MFLLEKVSELVGLTGLAQLLEGLELDLTYAFAGQGRCPNPLARGAASTASRRGRISRHKWPTPHKYIIGLGPELIGGCQTNCGRGSRPIWLGRADIDLFSRAVAFVRVFNVPLACVGLDLHGDVVGDFRGPPPAVDAEVPFATR